MIRIVGCWEEPGEGSGQTCHYHGFPVVCTEKTTRLIQDSTIDLVRLILSCNDQLSIKIAE